jgi:hypothetical protein
LHLSHIAANGGHIIPNASDCEIYDCPSDSASAREKRYHGPDELLHGNDHQGIVIDRRHRQPCPPGNVDNDNETFWLMHIKTTCGN